MRPWSTRPRSPRPSTSRRAGRARTLASLALLAWAEGAAPSPLLAPAAATAEPPEALAIPFDRRRPEIAQFVAHLVKDDGFRRRDLERLIAKAVPQQKILEAMTRPAEKVSPWWEYRAHFLTEERIRDGARFWSDHRLALERIGDEWGVSPEYIVAIVGVESFYGRLTGRYRVLDALTTLAFDYPLRSDYFRAELEQFLLLSREERVDPLTTLGSYAGAMGAGQFMPSSYREYAIDEDHDGRRDLWNSWDDVLASIAHYFRGQGWQPGAPVLAEATLDPDSGVVVDPRNLELNDTVAGLRAKGVEFEAPLAATEPALLLLAEGVDGPVYRVGFHNFHVITRYNHSVLYALAVHDLASAILARRAANPT
jgi:membrane-bound lytic murein transglycosylase B